MRIVSLLPSVTEILFAIGAGDEVAGVTFECNYPPEARSRRVVSTSALSQRHLKKHSVSPHERGAHNALGFSSMAPRRAISLRA